MAFDYTTFYNLSRRLLDNFGKDIILGKLNKTPADPDKPWVGRSDPRVEATETVKGVYLSPRDTDFGTHFISEELLNRINSFILFAPEEGKDFMLFDVVIEGTVLTKIVNKDLIKPTDTPLLYCFALEL
jgi:hypothetical protein